MSLLPEPDIPRQTQFFMSSTSKRDLMSFLHVDSSVPCQMPPKAVLKFWRGLLVKGGSRMLKAVVVSISSYPTSFDPPVEALD